MRLSISAFLLFAAGTVSLHAQSANSALSAIKLLPKGESKRLARIEARDGSPVPERWYLLVHNPSEETGLHEYVVAGGELVASRSLSQFAEGLKPDEVIGAEPIKIDSDRAGKVAQQYALANNVVAATYNYQLRKDADDGTPMWSVTCLDRDGKPLGAVMVAAVKGNVVSHSGFAAEPSPDKLPPPDSDEDQHDTQHYTKKRYVVHTRPVQQPRQAQAPREAEKPNILQRLFGGGAH